MKRIPISDKYVISYDETGKALFYITYDVDNFFWDISVDSELKDMYEVPCKKLDEFAKMYFSDSKISNPRFFEVSFVQKATELLSLIKETCPSKEKYRLPDFLLDTNGDLDIKRLSVLWKMRRIDVRTAQPYAEGNEKKQLIEIIPYLFDLVNDERMWGDETLRLESRSLNEFESRLVNVDLRFAWFECRHEATRFYCFIDDSYEFYFAMDKNDIPMFMYFLPLLEKNNDAENCNSSNAA